MQRPAAVIPYEDRLNRDPRWALKEGSRHFEGNSGVQQTLERITRRLNELDIPYAVVGGMALFRHGLRRFTEDVDLLVTQAGLKQVHEQLDGLGYVPLFAGSKRLRDTTSGVTIVFLISGQFPGDGKPKPVAFPDPATASIELEEVRYIALPRLVELKLASGMTGSCRRKDLGDVEQLIKLLKLPKEFAAQLDPYVQPEFESIWADVQAPSPFES